MADAVENLKESIAKSFEGTVKLVKDNVTKTAEKLDAQLKDAVA